jgi:hypothetical protein
MKNQSHQTLNPPVSAMYNSSVSLYKLVNKLQASLLSRATARKSFIINDIDKSIAVAAEENMLSYVIGSILISSVYSSTASCIRIEAASADNQLQIRIRNSNAFVYSSYERILGEFLDAANKLGGNIGLEAEENSGVTVVFSMTRQAA